MSTVVVFGLEQHRDGQATPIAEIPAQFQMLAKLPGEVVQVIDKRRCYNWDGTQYVESALVALDAFLHDEREFCVIAA